MSTIYHVTKRENEGREWKVFIQGSDKVIKLFPTQQEALEYAKDMDIKLVPYEMEETLDGSSGMTGTKNIINNLTP